MMLGGKAGPKWLLATRSVQDMATSSAAGAANLVDDNGARLKWTMCAVAIFIFPPRQATLALLRFRYIFVPSSSSSRYRAVDAINGGHCGVEGN